MARSRKRHRKRVGRRRVTPGKVAVGGVLVLLLGYFAFTKLFFDPFEESQREFTLLVPWNVDLFVHRRELDSDFLAFPRPREVQRLLASTEWRTFAASPWWQSLQWPRDLEVQLTEATTALAQAPFDVLADVLGTEVALVGRDLAGEGGYALLARLSPKGKLAFEALDFGAAFSQAFPGATRTPASDPEVPDVRYSRLELATGDLLFLARETDLLVVADDELLVRDVLRTLHGGAQLSVGLSRLYLDHMPRPRGADAERFSAGFTLTTRDLFGDLTLAPEEGERQRDAVANILPRLVDPTLMRDAVGRVEIDQGTLRLRAYADLDVSRAGQDTGGLLGREAQTVSERLMRALESVPGDVTAVVTLNVSLRTFLRTVVDGFDPDFRKLLDDSLRDVARNNPTWRVDNALALIDALDGALGGQLTVVLRPVDHAQPPGVQPLPTLAFAAPLRDPAAWEAIETGLLGAWHVLGLDREKMFQMPEGGVGTQKWVGVPGLPFEEVAWIVLDKERLVLSTDHDFVSEIARVYTGTDKSLLARQQGTRRLLEGFTTPAPFEARGNAMGWVHAGRLAEIVQAYAGYVADLETQIDFGVERAKERKQLVARDYPTWRGREDELPEDVAAAIDARLDELMDALEARRREQDAPAFQQQWLASWAWLGLLEEAAFSLRLGDRSLDLDLHLATVTAP